mmetsp:Transcript_7653/g.20465  ORF Transcript_7653/g.20465 Transcript_7653/m.20465 type:complete len:212 (-) Transcript_7653:338-973(-)
MKSPSEVVGPRPPSMAPQASGAASAAGPGHRAPAGPPRSSSPSLSPTSVLVSEVTGAAGFPALASSASPAGAASALRPADGTKTGASDDMAIGGWAPSASASAAAAPPRLHAPPAQAAATASSHSASSWHSWISTATVTGVPEGSHWQPWKCCAQCSKAIRPISETLASPQGLPGCRVKPKTKWDRLACSRTASNMASVSNLLGKPEMVAV